MSASKRLPKKSDSFLPFWVWPLYFLILWQILLLTQNPGLMSDDSGEMVAAAVRLGLPHPPGYPLFDLIGRLFSFVPVGGVAFRFNLLAELLMLLSLAFVFDTCRKLNFHVKNPTFQRFLLIVIGLVFISYRSTFAQSLTAKGCIYAMTLLSASVLMWLKIKEISSTATLFLVWFIWGVGMANHWQTQILWLPGLAFWFYQTQKAKPFKSLLLVGTLSLLGLSLYLYLPIRANLGVQPCWGFPAHWSGFYWVVTRQLVKDVETYLQPWSFYLHSFHWIFVTLFCYWLPGFLALAAAGVITFWRKEREFFYFLALLFLPVFLGVASVHEERNQYLVPVYFVPLAGVVTIFGFAGMNWIVEKFFKNQAAARGFLVFLTAASLGWLVYVSHQEDKSRYTLAEDFGRNVLKEMPRNALLLADGDHYVMPIWYQKYALGLRPDVVFLPSVFLYHGWGWEQLASQAEDLQPAVFATNLSMGRLKALTEESRQHPFFYSLGREYLEPVLEQLPGQWVPRGLAYEWLERVPNSQAVAEAVLTTAQRERFRGIQEEPDFAGMDPSTLQIYRYYALQYDLAAQYLDKLSLESGPKTPK